MLHYTQTPCSKYQAPMSLAETTTASSGAVQQFTILNIPNPTCELRQGPALDASMYPNVVSTLAPKHVYIYIYIYIYIATISRPDIYHA